MRGLPLFILQTIYLTIMEKKLRVSKDYVAVDLIKENGFIHSTPIYLQINKPRQLMWKDQEELRALKTTVTYNGHSLDCRDCEGMEWQSDVSELLTEARPLK